MRRIFSMILAVTSLLSLLLVGDVSVASAATRHDNDSSFSHIFYIMMENHGDKEILGNTADAPYINSLASRYSVATQYFGVTHPSLPNYLAGISGNFQGIWDDCAAGPTSTCAPEEFGPDSGYTKTLLTNSKTMASPGKHTCSRCQQADSQEQPRQ